MDARSGFDPTSVFDPVAAEYRSDRPGYPDALYAMLDELVGGLSGKAVADLGAGTGIATVALAARGARVLAVEPSRAMLGELALPSLSGRAEALPLRSASQDLVTCAQAWHWVQPTRAVPECRRVLKPAGQLVLWWNVSESDGSWVQEIEAVSGVRPYGAGGHQDDAATLTGEGAFTHVVRRSIPWRWKVPVERWLRVAATRTSSVASLREGKALPVDEMRAVLRQHFPSGEVNEDFSCQLTAVTAV